MEGNSGKMMANMHVERLATEFGVSEQAMTIRLFTLGFL